MSSLLRLGRKQKNSSSPFRIRIFLFLSYLYSFGIDTINTFIHPRSSFENHTWFQTKLGENPARWGGTYLYSLYKGVDCSPHFCLFKYARAVQQKVWNEAENSERDWGETLKIPFFLSRLPCEARALRARKTLTSHITFLNWFWEKKKPDFFAV